MNVPKPQTNDLARSLWYVQPGRAEIREETLPQPSASEVRVRALHTPGHRPRPGTGSPETVEWAAKQAWSNGIVGTIGDSYPG